MAAEGDRGSRNLELAAHIVTLATDAGASEAEATYTVADRFSTEARDIEITKLEQSVGRNVALRVLSTARRPRSQRATSRATV